jgi:RNA polymerase sigma-70 factor (ECF subfamily)
MEPSATQLEQHRADLTGHCYRMLGSAIDADDAVQETIVRLDRFDGRASLRDWLYRIATNVCVDALADRSRRARPMELGPPGSVDDPFHELPQTHWLEPIPDGLALPADADPSERAVLRQSIRLAFVFLDTEAIFPPVRSTSRAFLKPSHCGDR